MSSPTEALAAIARRVVICKRCPELRAYCAQIARVKKREHRDSAYWGKPVPGFGDRNARLLIVGLAPGAHGSNRTGRMFTGDASGVWLYRTLHRAGFANQRRSVSIDDGLELRDAYITAALRCAPPGNKPTPLQRKRCLPFLLEELDAMPRVRVIVTLGKLADDTIHAVFRQRYRLGSPRVRFTHGAQTLYQDETGRSLIVIASYHPSRQNTNTGVLTEPMLDEIFRTAASLLRKATGTS
ncbi:MAG TPA: uracil-DNA glycosylase [Candidatus Binatia bacterium]|nr:uracil-DNA glycosylase [Candidatus Binatia bacterium]